MKTRLLTPLAATTFLLLCALTTPATAQNFKYSGYTGKWWVNAMPITYISDQNLGGNVSLNVIPFEHQLLTLDYTGDYQETTGGKNISYSLGLLYGLIAKNDYGYISGSVGVSHIRFELYNNPSIPLAYYHTDVVGFPVQAQAFWTPCSYFGVGMIAFGNFNSVKNLGGVGIGIQFGDLK